MRMKYLQVAMEVVEQLGPDLGTLLYPRARREDAEARAGWGLLKMIRWALGRCPDDAPPSANAVVHGSDAARLIAAAAGYRGRDPEAFVDACTKLMPSPLLERVDGGIRVRGLDRYDAAWRERRGLGAADDGTASSRVYLIRRGVDGPIKIGVSRAPRARLAQLQTGCAEPLTLLAVLPGGAKREAELHARFVHLRLEGEWFRPAVEILALASEKALA